MRKVPGFFPKILSRIDFLIVLLIIAISFLSIGKILQFYFYYDDLFLFYGVQFPDDVNSIFATPEITGYRFLQPFFTPQFALFGYNPLGYYVVSFFLWLLVSFLFYYFARLAYNSQKIAIFATVIMASGYVGIESLIWNVGAGQNASAFLVMSLLTLISILLYLRFCKYRYLTIAALSFTVAVCFFQFRSFLLFAWLPLLVLIQKRKSTREMKNLSLFTILLLVFGIFLFRQSFGYSNQGDIAHLQINFLDSAKIFLRNTSNFLFPSELLSYISTQRSIPISSIELGFGMLAILIFAAIPFIAFRKKSPLSGVIFFFAAACLASLAMMQLAVGLIGNPPDVWLSRHRFYVVILPFLAGFLGGSLGLFRVRKAAPLALLVIWAASHIALSNRVMVERWDNPISHIAYFYNTLKQRLPKLNKDSVLLVTQGDPAPVSIFVTGNFVHGHTGIAGFYGMRVSDFLLARSPIEAAKLLNARNLSADRLFAFHYKRMELVDVTQETRELLRYGKTVPLGQNLSGTTLEFSDLSLSVTAPMLLDMSLRVYPAFGISMASSQDEVDVLEVEKYFSMLIKQKRLRDQMKVTSESAPLSEDHKVTSIIDGDYSTTWIPKDWQAGGVEILVDLGSIKRINRIAWSSSRTATWFVRLPSEYEIAISRDGENFSKIKSINDAPILRTGDFFLEEFMETEVRYIKLVIEKTRGGLTPAIDEIEVFGGSDGDINFSEYFMVNLNPAGYFPNTEIANRYLDEVLDGVVAVAVDWRVDKNTDYPIGNSYKLDTQINKTGSYHVLLPATGQVLKSIRIRSQNFPAKVSIIKATIVYPKLEEFKEDELKAN